MFDKQSNSPFHKHPIEYYFSNKWLIRSFYLLHHKKVNHDNVCRVQFKSVLCCIVINAFLARLNSANLLRGFIFYYIKSCRGKFLSTISSDIFPIEIHSTLILFDLVIIGWKNSKLCKINFLRIIAPYEIIKNVPNGKNHHHHHWMQNWKCLSITVIITIIVFLSDD